jgi:hypothetical protein
MYTSCIYDHVKEAMPYTYDVQIGGLSPACAPIICGPWHTPLFSFVTLVEVSYIGSIVDPITNMLKMTVFATTEG